MDSATATGTIGSHTDLYYATDYASQAGYHPCPGQCNGQFWIPDTAYMNGVGPYSVNVNYGSLLFSDGNTWQFGDYCVDDMVGVTVQDANGCNTAYNVDITGPDPVGPMQVLQLNGACAGATNGSVQLDVPSPLNSWPMDILIEDSNGSNVYSSMFGGGVFVVSNLGVGVHTIYRSFGASHPTCSEQLQFTVPDLGTTCGSVNGKLYVDSDGDCIIDPGEFGIPNKILEINPGGMLTITNSAGNFSSGLNFGSYDLTQPSAPGLFPICPATQPVPFSISAGAPVAQIDLADSSNIQLDLTPYIGSGFARPGFQLQYSINVRNLSPQVSGPITVVFDHDPSLVFLNNSGTVTGPSQITWNLNASGGYQDRYVNPRFMVPVATPLGMVLTATASVTNTMTDVNPNNDTRNHSVTVTGSYDPNDKLSDPSDQFFIGQDSVFTYTIRFQNTGTDTAFTVLITDTLTTDLDPLTIVPTASSHPYEVSLEGQGTLKFLFDNIQLPDSNVNESESHGFVSFEISPTYPVLPGEQIENVANIFFDFNPPVITDPNILVATVSTNVYRTPQPTLFASTRTRPTIR